MYKREWLNDKEGMAAILISATDRDDYFDGSVSISDCHRTVTLDFDFSKRLPFEKRKILRKLDRLINNLSALRKEIADAVPKKNK